MSSSSVPTLEDYGHDAIGDFVRDVPDEEREEILNELYQRQRAEFEELDIGEFKHIQGGGVRIHRESVDNFRVEFLSPTQELRHSLHNIVSNVLGR